MADITQKLTSILYNKDWKLNKDLDHLDGKYISEEFIELL